MTAATDVRRIEIDGRPAGANELRAAALSGFGHFTAMQVRGRKVRGFRQHLARLDAANKELFGYGVDEQVLRARITHALADDVADASVRVYLLETAGETAGEPAGEPTLMVTVRPPGGMPPGPWRLSCVPYQRSLAHIKRAVDFGQHYYQRLVHARGFDEALLTGPDGIISEGSITNVGCFDGRQVIWPAAPALSGITMQLIRPALADRGLPSASAHIRVADLGSFTGVFVTNARGVAAVGQVDDIRLPVDEQLVGTLAQCLESLAWDDI